jgi:acyl carrier protein
MPEVKSDALENEIRKVIAKIIEIDEEKVGPDSHLVQELGADSMRVLEIMVLLDKKFKIEIPESEIPKMTTLRQITQLVSERAGA